MSLFAAWAAEAWLRWGVRTAAHCLAVCCSLWGRGVPGGQLVTAEVTAQGLRWGSPRVVLSEQAYGPVPKVIANPPIVDPSTGRWVLPYWCAAASAPPPRTAPHCPACHQRRLHAG